MTYFTPYEAAPSLFHIYEPGDVHCTLIVGRERALLFDTGYGFCDIREAVSALTDLPLTIVNSHGHLDHAGGNFWFEQKIYIHPYERQVYDLYQKEKESLMDRMWSLYQQGKKPRPWPEGFDRQDYYSYKPCSFIDLTDGQVFDLGGRIVEVFFFPGHTRGCVALYDHQSGLLLSGDNLGHSIWIMFEQSAPLAEYRSCLCRLKDSFDIKGILGSHYGGIYPASLIDTVIQCIDQRHDGNSTIFTHPRKGYKALRRKVPLTGVPGIKDLYLIPFD
ncbi:MAG: MBL fold metallo-hydrolase [Emergencia timonensis]